MVDIEICIEQLPTALIADQYGAKRVELCSALALGGLTPTLGMIEACFEHCSLEIHAMIRPRAGGFVYSDNEISIMQQNIKYAAEYGATGVVFGCLDDQHHLDESHNLRLLETAKSFDLAVTFHRAFDRCQHPEKGLESLITWGVDRILTSGQAQLAIDGAKNLSTWKAIIGDQIEIMAGSGVNATNAKQLIEYGVDALHFSARRKTIKTDTLGMGEEYSVDEEKIKAVFQEIMEK